MKKTSIFKTNFDSFREEKEQQEQNRNTILIALLVKTACFSADPAVDQGMRYERGEMR